MELMTIDLTKIQQRLLSHPAFPGFPASVLGAWLASAVPHRVAAGERWHDDVMSVDWVRVLIPDDRQLPVAQAGLERMLGCGVALQDESGRGEYASGKGWLLQLPTAILQEAMRHDDAVKARLLRAFATPPDTTSMRTSRPVRQPLDWLGVLALPAAAHIGLPLLGLSVAATAYVGALSVGLWIWLRELAPPFVGALLVLATLVLGGAVPVGVAFGGFAESGIFLLVGILSLGYLIGSSGLAQRITQTLLQRLPPTARGYHAGLFFLGTLLTLILPSAAVRIQIVSSIIARPGDQRGQGASSQSTHLAVAALTGVSALSTVFLTSNAVNFLMLGMLPEPWRQHFGWLAWFKAAAGFLLPFLLAYGVFFWLVTRRAAFSLASSAASVTTSPWRPDEKVAATAIALFAIGAASASFHHIAIPLVAVAVYLWLHSNRMLDENAATPPVNWPMVLYLTAMIGLVRSFDALRLESELSQALTWLPVLASRSPAGFLMVLIVTTAVLRLFLPAMACISVLCIMLIPLTSASSVNPWLITFIVSTTSEGWFFPYQSSDYQLFRASVGSALDSGERQFLEFNAIIQALKLAALALAIPYWDVMGLL